ncbi:MAG: GIY-YIG nuclease family protein [Kiritimatiellia bacterium]
MYIIYSPILDRFYIGKTSDFERRLQQHRSGESTYTKRANDWHPACCIQVETASEADLLERKIKKAKSRKTILRYIDGPDNLIRDFKI